MKLPQHALRCEAEQPSPARGRRETHQRLYFDPFGRMPHQREADRARQQAHVPARRLAEDRPGDGAALPAFLKAGAGNRLAIDERGPAGTGISHLLGPAVFAQSHAEMLLVRLKGELVQVVRCVRDDEQGRQPLS